MVDVVNRDTGELRLSVNTPDYSDAEWLYLPAGERQRVQAIPQQYRKIEGGRVVEMSADERAAVEAAKLESYKAARIAQLEEQMMRRLARQAPELVAAESRVEAAQSKAEVDAVSLG
jgi:hypothetical protein